MRIAIVGSGISGLVAAYLLSSRHSVVLFEGAERLGGHTNTVNVDVHGVTVPVDTGFIVYNDRTYPNFIGLLNELQVSSQPTTMGFSVRCQRCGLEYAGSSVGSLFAQKRNLLRPGFYRLLADIVRFNRSVRALWESLPDERTVGEFLTEHRYSDSFAEHYLLPMGGAIWSCPMATFREFPIRFIIEFYQNHGLLDFRNRPTWRTLVGGSKTYIDRMMQRFPGEVRLNAPVHRILRDEQQVIVQGDAGSESFDEVILACPADQAVHLLHEPSQQEREVLSAFPYSQNVAVLHTDTSQLPQRQRVWSSWNYAIPSGDEQRPTVTYNMNILQRLDEFVAGLDRTFCVTLNPVDQIAPEQIVRTFQYSHPIFTTGRAAAQRRHGELIRHRRTSFCGAYWGNGFHEDGVKSALAVCARFGVDPGWGRPSSNERTPTLLGSESDPRVML